METAADAISHALNVSLALMRRYCGDLKPEEYLQRPVPKANCAAWILGHLVLSERRPLLLLGADLPPLPDGFEARFPREESAAMTADFGDVSLLLPLFDRHRSLLIETVCNATRDQLDKPLEKPHPLFSTVGEAVGFAAQHATLHAGQITIIRRSLGKPPLV